MSERRSAIIVAFRLPSRIRAIRRLHVPIASVGVPPHITILSPFMPANALGEGVRARLAVIAGGHRAFDVRFERCGSFPDALYLAPVPARPFGDLTVVICGAFPGYPPYGEATIRPEDVEPHLTIAIGDRATFDPLVELVTPSLPIVGRAGALSVIVEGDDGGWRTRWRIGLRP